MSLGSRRTAFRSGLIAAVAVAGLVFPPGPVTPPAAGAGPEKTSLERSTTLDDQVDLAVTVYNSNIALVRDVRQLTLPAGLFALRFGDIAASVHPATVHFRSLTEPAGLAVLEQNYEYDLLEPQKLLQKYVGREVTLVRARQEGGSTRYDEVKALLLAYNNGPVWKIGNEIVTGLTADSIRFPELPENLYSRPTLLWSLQNKSSARQRVEASYLADNMSWSADYVLTVGREEKTADLDGWVTLVNNTGTAYQNARLQLVAGDLHRLMPQYPPVPSAARRTLEMAPASPEFAQEAFSEYHLYTLGRRTSIQDRETKQISLLNASGFAVEKAYVVEGHPFYYHNPHPGSPIKEPVQIYFQFRNDETSGLDMPLPAGTVRVYQADSKGSVQFVGEDRIEHTPKDEAVRLHTGNAFDVVAERKQTDFRKLSDRLYELEFEITLRNHKESPIVVEVREPVGGDWELLASTHPGTKADARTLRFQVPVEKGGTSVMKYRVRIHW